MQSISFTPQAVQLHKLNEIYSAKIDGKKYDVNNNKSVTVFFKL